MFEMLIIYISCFVILLIGLYALMNIAIIAGRFSLQYSSPERISEIKFSIVIPMRNEANNIGHIINDLTEQKYSKENYEIIIVDDWSEDKGVEQVESLNLTNLKLIKSQGKGKKEAVFRGVKSAINSFIVQIDADCRVGENYLKTLSNYLENNEVKLLAAPVIYKRGGSIFSKFQELEFLSLMMSTMGLIGLRKPVMVNGANLIYPKSVFKDLNALNCQSVSGDDVFLLHYIKKEYGNKAIRFLNSDDATVLTSASDNLKDFLNQRIRWASKSKYYRDLDTILIGAIVFLVNLTLTALFFLAFFSESLTSLFVLGFAIKMLVDIFLIIPIIRQYKKYYLWVYFPLLSFIYPFYVSFVGIISPLAKFEWKNRNY